MKRERIGVDRTTITFSLPVGLKKEIEHFILLKNLENDKKESVSYFCLKSVKCYLQVQNIKNFEGLKKIWSEVFICNTNINLNKKLEILKKFKKEIEVEVEELESYFNYKKIKNLENDSSIKEVENLGEMASWVVEEIKKVEYENNN